MRRFCSVVVLLAATLFGSVLLAPSAFAHATLSSSDPADGDRLDSVPDRVELTFSEPVGLSNGYLRVIDENGGRVDDGSPEADRTQVSVGLRADLPDGSFLISYRLISADFHPIAGALSFVVGNGPLIPASDAEQTAPSDPLVGVLFGVLRWLSYLGLALLVGPIVIAGLCWSRASDTPSVRRLFRVGIWLSIGTALVSVIVEALYVSGLPVTRLLSIDVIGILGTTYGISMLTRIALVSGLALMVARTLLFRPEQPDEPAAGGVSSPAQTTQTMRTALSVSGALVIGIALTYSLSGHPIASTVPALAVLSDGVHLLAMSVWLGGLLLLIAGLLPTRDVELLADVLPGFSRLALVSIVALLISGTVQAVLEITPLAALWSTTYGLLVAAKVTGLVVIVYLGNLARHWVRDRYGRPVEGARAEPEDDEAGFAGGRGLRPTTRNDSPSGDLTVAERPSAVRLPATFEGLRRSLQIEVAVAAVVLAVAAALVATIPARTAYVQPFAESLALPDGGSAEVTLDPAQSGPNLMHVYLQDETGQPLEVQAVNAVAALPEQEIGPLEIPLQPTGPGHYTADGFSLPVAGLWELTFTIRFGEFDAAAATAEVPIS